MTADYEERQLQKLEANALTVMLTSLGTIADTLAEKSVGSERIENIAILAIEQAHIKIPERYTRSAGLGGQQEWRERQEAALEEAEAKFAGIINYIVALRDGEAPAEED